MYDRYQGKGLKSYALIGTQMAARSLELDLPAAAKELVAPKVSLTVATAENVWESAENPRLHGYVRDARKRELQVLVIQASSTGEKSTFPPWLQFPYQFEGGSANFQKSEIYAVPFSGSDSGTKLGTSEIIRDCQSRSETRPPTASWEELGLLQQCMFYICCG